MTVGAVDSREQRARRSLLLSCQKSLSSESYSSAKSHHLVAGGWAPSRWEKPGRGGTEDELGKPLVAVQRVKFPPDQSRADRSVVSLAIHRATGGCEA